MTTDTPSAIRHRHGLELHTHVPPGSGPTHHHVRGTIGSKRWPLRASPESAPEYPYYRIECACSYRSG